MSEKMRQKLTSRKFWAAVAAWITSIIACFGLSQDVTAQVTSIALGTIALIAYIVAETSIDTNKPTI